MRVSATPHDLLKAVNWRAHYSRSAIEDFLPKCAKGKYKVYYRDAEGKTASKTLEEIVAGHHSTKSFWESLWSYADKLSTVAGRFRLDYDYWCWCDADPFMVKVYGGVKEWTPDERRRVAKKMADVLASNYGEGRQKRAFEEVNDLLSDFPADSRFPYTSLKTHHWLTEAIMRSGAYWARIAQARSMREEPTFSKIYIIRISISLTEFHRLKEMRGFIEHRRKVLESAEGALSGFFPLRVGDDLYVVSLEERDLEKIRSLLADAGSGYDISAFEWSIAREERRVGPDGRPERIYVIKGVLEMPQLSIGSCEDLERILESSAEYSEILGGEYEYVAWASLRPRGDMEYLSRSFLEWGEAELAARYGARRRELEEPVREPKEILSPELALSIADGYNEFLEDCAKKMNEANPRESFVVRSFENSILIRGLSDPIEGIRVYAGLADLKASLRIPVTLTVAVAKPKYPFWRILELFGSDLDCLVFVVGERMVRITDDVVKLLREVARNLSETSRKQFNEIIKKSKRASVEELKFMIEGKAVDGRIPMRAARSLCWLVDELSKKYSGDELKSVAWKCFKALEPYTKRKDRGWD